MQANNLNLFFFNLYTTAVEMHVPSALRQVALLTNEGIPNSWLPKRFPRRLYIEYISAL